METRSVSEDEKQTETRSVSEDEKQTETRSVSEDEKQTETRSVSEDEKQTNSSLTRTLHQLECDVRSTAFRRIQPAKAGTTNGLFRLMQNTITHRVGYQLWRRVANWTRRIQESR